MLWVDLADVDVIRVDDTYYFMASNMHYSPGAPILRSYDLVNWEFAGHAVPTLDYGPAFDLTNGQAYIKGTWASFLNYRKSNKTFYFGGSIQGGGDLMYTAKSVEGPWEKHQIRGGSGYYDAGLLIDDDDTMYVAYGNTNISVAQLAADGFSQVKNQKVYTASGETVEGSRFYKRDGKYYILVTRPPDAEHVLRSTAGPFGPYEKRPLVDRVAAPVSGAGSPHQGGLVETQNGDWYYMGFIDAYPGGRVPVLAPVEWSADGWPSVKLVNGKWSASYPFPNVPPAPRAVKGPTGVDTFQAKPLAHDWEWNHNPDDTKWSAGSGLTLQTATVTNDLYRARNTLTRRILGPTSTATIVLDHSGMKDGDRAGLAIFRHTTAWIGVRRDSGTTRVSMVNGLALSKSGWNTTSTGSEVASAAITGDKIWLRAAADIHPGTGKQVKFSYSTDGTTFTPFGAAFTMDNSWEFFMGYRYAIFNYATQALGGTVKVQSFELATP
jgi:beta-xylosidase